MKGRNQIQLNHLPLNGTDVHIRVWKKVDGAWQYDDYELQTPAQQPVYKQVTRTYLITDHLQTPRWGYSDKKIETWRWQSDAFGGNTVNDDVDGNGYQVNLNLRFPGQYEDRESGLYYNWNRYYDPKTGRYVTSDPIGLDGGLNTYGYVGANPNKYIDVNGLQAGTVGRLLGSGGAAGGGTIIGSGFGGSSPGGGGSTIRPEVLGTPGFFCYIMVKVMGQQSSGAAPCKRDEILCSDEDGEGKRTWPPYKGPENGYEEGPRRGRDYGEDGKPTRDYDKPHQGADYPHVHEWPGGVREHPGRPYSPVPKKN